MFDGNGYIPLRGNLDEYGDGIDIAQVPAYPDEVSIKRLDNVVIVMLSE